MSQAWKIKSQDITQANAFFPCMNEKFLVGGSVGRGGSKGWLPAPGCRAGAGAGWGRCLALQEPPAMPRGAQGWHLHPCSLEPVGLGFPPARAAIQVAGEGLGPVRRLWMDCAGGKMCWPWFLGTASRELSLRALQTCFLSETLGDGARPPARPLELRRWLPSLSPCPSGASPAQAAGAPRSGCKALLQLGGTLSQVPGRCVMESAAAGESARHPARALRDPALGAAAASQVGTGVPGVSGSFMGMGSPGCLFLPPAGCNVQK